MFDIAKLILPGRFGVAPVAALFFRRCPPQRRLSVTRVRRAAVFIKQSRAPFRHYCAQQFLLGTLHNFAALPGSRFDAL